MLADPSSRIPLENLPVFPLPGTVLFPDQQLPLHIFEPRYRQMTRDLLEGAPFLVVALLTGDGERPTFEPVATVGRLLTHQRLADGRYNILVEGAVRVRAEELPSERLYRRVQCAPLLEPQGPEALVAEADVAAMLALAGMVMQEARKRSPGLRFEPPAGLEPARLAWRVADRLLVEPSQRQRVLEAPTARERVLRTTEGLSALLTDLAPSSPRGRAQA